MKRKIISMFLIITVLIAFCSFSNGAENAQLDLNQQKDNVNSLDFIEEMAREKLDMYHPNERVYVDQGM